MSIEENHTKLPLLDTDILSFIKSRAELSDDDIDNNEYGIGLYFKNEHEIQIVNDLLKSSNCCVEIINATSYLKDNTHQMVIRPNLSITLISENDTVFLGQFEEEFIFSLIKIMLKNKINYGSTTQLYTFN